MNETIFLLHLFVAVGFAFVALRMGKEALMAWIAMQGVLANLFVVKETTLFYLQVTCSDVYAVGSFLCLNLLQEHYGKETAGKGVSIALVCQLFFLGMSQLHLLYEPSINDQSQGAFQTILGIYPRVTIASLAVFYFVQRMDVVVFDKFKRIWPRMHFVYRGGACLVISQVVDTVLFSFLGLYGVVHAIGDVMLMSLVIKGALIVLTSPFLKLIKPVPVHE